ncbi:hypothetical protein SS1G_09994 [Sclerotinia sclerotiorum 1980 UF-70]|uniref:Uncharacterized protein n=1 Tax=Sclerotinia sclerotiorum (strain ATCC 18683 / 1980 / Ss-1) TaxID=665079 RepID=A7EXD3_SCLS1|nr:hypothetical protein SS1G_09994 [Sclerotinia sclerotiorum 1980 UF-70]EDN94125.1 hypothetical protein SS1G_09994 [Sclerotinia sclerotiorum 1980 UF-70]
MAKLPRSWHSPLSGFECILSFVAAADIEVFVEVGFTRSSNNVVEVAIADVTMDVGEASRKVEEVDVGSKPGGGSISCLVRRKSIFLKVCRRIEDSW